MDDYKIRLGHTDSVDSVDNENFLDVRVQNTSKEFHFNDVKKTIDQYELFQQEREKCNRYRLILTINPFCSNVLFNPFTEIVKFDEDINKCERYIDNGETPRDIVDGIDGEETPKRIQMICNTEYSKKENGYIYYPGFDMFDNHILRNKSFKVVTKSNNHQGEYNTLADNLRDNNGVIKKMYSRTNGLSEMPEQINMHLYTFEDVLNYEDSVNSNLFEENGWFGFINHSNLVTKQGEGVERVLNNKEACEFIDMYPNRELFSFNPSYNERFDRLEYNWDIALTYPYENEFNNTIVYGNGINGLKILSTKIDYDQSGEFVAVLRCFVKHNLKRNDSITMWYAVNGSDTVGEYTQIENYIRVKNVGNLKNRDEEYCFIVNGEELFSVLETTKNDLITMVVNILMNNKGKGILTIDNISEIIDLIDGDKITIFDLYHVLAAHYDKTKTDIILTTLLDGGFSLRFRHIVNGEPSKYYIRKFKKIPNFKKKKRDVVENDLIDRNTFNEYENGDGNAVYYFDKEFYKLGFATTIYGDDCSQITYTDTIDVEHLTDNLGRPLSELYATIIKRNKGNDIWYTSETKSEIFGPDVEQSHCFGELTSGFSLSAHEGDSTDIINERAAKSDILLLNNTENPVSMFRASEPLERNISIDNLKFYGDIVEFVPYEFKEYVLSDVNYRFNTYQREHPLRTIGTNEKIPFIYHNIEGDDYDYPSDYDGGDSGFYMEKIMLGSRNGQSVSSQYRDEGYYYKAHYKIGIREFGDLQQDSHFDLTVKSVTPIQKGKIFLRVKTNLPHRLNSGDKVLLFDDNNNFKFEFYCSYVENRTTFYIIPCIPMDKNNEWVFLEEESSRYYMQGLTWLSVTEYLREKVLVLRRKNYLIPDYAVRAGKNTYLWRDLLSVNERGNDEVPEFTYTNNAFYVSKTIDFFLKRQDADGNTGLYAKDIFPNDVIGQIKKDSIYEYKEEIVPVC